MCFDIGEEGSSAGLTTAGLSKGKVGRAIVRSVRCARHKGKEGRSGKEILRDAQPHGAQWGKDESRHSSFVASRVVFQQKLSCAVRCSNGEHQARFIAWEGSVNRG